MEAIEPLNDNYDEFKKKVYKDIKFLISQPQWISYEKLLNREKDTLIFNLIKNPYAYSEGIKFNLQTLDKIINMPYSIVKEIEEREQS